MYTLSFSRFILTREVLIKLGVNTALDVPLDCSRTPYGGVGFTVFSQSTISFTYGVRVKVQVRAVFLATDDPTKTMGLEWVLFLILHPVR